MFKIYRITQLFEQYVISQEYHFCTYLFRKYLKSSSFSNKDSFITNKFSSKINNDSKYLSLPLSCHNIGALRGPEFSLS